MRDATEPRRVERRRLGGWTSALIVAVAISGVLLVLTGCDTALDAITDSERPTNVSATDGEFSDRIKISWTAPEPAEDESEDQPELIGYDVIRWDADDGSVRLSDDLLSGEYLSAAKRSYVDDRSSLRQGLLYEYRIQALYSGGTWATSAPDTGYAITASDISAGSTLSRHVRPYDADADPSTDGKVWFRLMVQRGWNYEVLADASTTAVRFLHEEQLEPAPETSRDSETGSYTFTAGHGGFYLIELDGGSGSVSVRYLGAK